MPKILLNQMLFTPGYGLNFSVVLDSDTDSGRKGREAATAELQVLDTSGSDAVFGSNSIMEP